MMKAKIFHCKLNFSCFAALCNYRLKILTDFFWGECHAIFRAYLLCDYPGKAAKVPIFSIPLLFYLFSALHPK